MLHFIPNHRHSTRAALLVGLLAVGCASGDRSAPASPVEPERAPVPYRVIEAPPGGGVAVDRPLPARVEEAPPVPPEPPLPDPEPPPPPEPEPPPPPDSEVSPPSDREVSQPSAEAEVSAPVAADIPYGGSRSLIGTTAGASPATALLSASAERGPLGVTVEIRGDGALGYSAFRLTAPQRLVIDFQGVENRLESAEQVFGIGRLGRIRSAVFRPPPSPVVRVVLDLAGAGGVAVEDADGALRLTLLP